MNKLTVKLPIEPVPKGRPRFAHFGRAVRTYTPKKTTDYETDVGVIVNAEMRRQGFERIEDGAVGINAYFAFKYPKSTPKSRQNGSNFKTTKPDLDNLLKAVLDGLNGVAFKDDNQVASFSATKAMTPGDSFVLLEVERI